MSYLVVLLTTLLATPLLQSANSQYCDGQDTGYLSCENLNESTVDLLIQGLNDTALLWDSFVVELWYCELTGFPVDIFANYSIDMVYISDCWSDDRLRILHDILGGIVSNLTWLTLYNDSMIQQLTSAELDWPFKDSLQDLKIAMNPISYIEPNAFRGYEGVTSMSVAMNTIPVHLFPDTFAGLTSLADLDLSFNYGTTVDVGGFGELPALRSLDLSYNNLTFLQEGVFNGLPARFWLSLQGNEFNCSCELQWLKDWLSETDQLISSSAYCAYPKAGRFAEIDFCLNNITTTEMYTTARIQTTEAPTTFASTTSE